MAKTTWRDYKKNLNAIQNIFEKEKEMIFFDCETTGLSVKKSKIIQISGIKYEIVSGNLIEKDILNVYINPEMPLNPKIMEITGITDDLLADKPTEDVAFTEIIYPFFGDSPVLCGYNSKRFDSHLLENLYLRQNHSISIEKQIDILDIARDITVNEDVPDKKLSTLCAYFGLDAGLTFHNALDDVRATARLFQYAYETYLKMEEEEKENSKSLNVPTIKSLSFWNGYRGHSRVYIHTNYGEFFYDVYNKKYGKQDESMFKLNEFNMEKFVEDVLSFAGATTNEEMVARIKKERNIFA